MSRCLSGKTRACPAPSSYAPSSCRAPRHPNAGLFKYAHLKYQLPYPAANTGTLLMHVIHAGTFLLPVCGLPSCINSPPPSSVRALNHPAASATQRLSASGLPATSTFLQLLLLPDVNKFIRGEESANEVMDLNMRRAYRLLLILTPIIWRQHRSSLAKVTHPVGRC